MDRYMLIDKHIDAISKKVIGTLMLISRISATLDEPSRIIAVESLVVSIISYCIRIWKTTNVTKLNKVQKLQNFAAEVAIGGAKKCYHVTPTTKVDENKIKT